MAIKKKQEEKPKPNLFTCVLCGSELRKEAVYKSRNKLLNEPYTLCKACARREANQNIENFHKVLMFLDVPFLPELYKQCEEEVDIFGSYSTRINNPKKRHDNGKTYMELRYIDSPSLGIIQDVDKYLYLTDDELAVLQDMFGTWWDKDELLIMKNELRKMFIQHGGDEHDILRTGLYTELISLKWLSRKKFKEGLTKEGKDLSEYRSKLLKENGLTIQAMRDKADNESFGSEIDRCEYEPIIPNKKFKDIDGIEFMFDKLRDQLLRFINVNKAPVEEEALNMIKYVEAHPEYGKIKNNQDVM